MKFTAKQISAMLNGVIEGDPEASVSTLAKIEEGQPGSLSFLANPLYTQYIYTTNASIVIVANSFVPERPVKATLVKVDNPEIAFAKLLEVYNQIKNNKIGISSLAYIAPTAKLGTNVYVGEFAVIGENVVIGDHVKIHPHVAIAENTVIGDHTTLFAGVKIYSDNRIGRNCVIHAGVVIGSDGFRFAQTPEGNVKVAQIGNVVIEDDVELGANCTIDRATLGSTILRRGVKLDNLVHIAHNVEVGENTVMAAGTGVAGSTKIGKNCLISGHVSFTGHITIADGTQLGGATGVSKSLTKPGQAYLGSPALEVGKFRKSYVYFRNFPEIIERLERLEKIEKERSQKGG
jgi:UDP-3-O-[3-hydroxymyristoyl] glucosamine N-acyltransferase